MAFNGSEGAVIALDMAAAWTENYRSEYPGTTLGVFFGKDILNQILAQEGCMGIRMYFALNDSAENTLVLVGADAQENDQTNGVIADFGSACPPVCGTGNVLNS